MSGDMHQRHHVLTRMLASRLLRWALLALPACVVTRVAPLQAQQPAATAGVRGTVVDAVTGRPVAGAVVQALHSDTMVARTLSDERGRFLISVAPVRR